MHAGKLGVQAKRRGGLYVELPSLDRFARLFARDHDDQLRDLAAGHPFVELGHDFLDVGFDLVVVGDWSWG